MLKKILLSVVYVGIVGLLVFGAVHRTEAKSESGNGESRAESEIKDSQISHQENTGGGQGAGNRSGGESRGAELNGSSDREYQAQAEQEEHDFSTYQGVVISVSDDALEIEITGAEILLVEGQAWRYMLTNGFETAVGNAVEISGFYEDGEYKPSWLKDLSSGLEIEIRDPSGRPNWSGGR